MDLKNLITELLAGILLTLLFSSEKKLRKVSERIKNIILAVNNILSHPIAIAVQKILFVVLLLGAWLLGTLTFTEYYLLHKKLWFCVISGILPLCAVIPLIYINLKFIFEKSSSPVRPKIS